MTHQQMKIKIKELEKRIDALEQDPFINKPCVSSGVCEHDKNKVLDKIRAEIEEVVVYDGIYISRSYVLGILDKYKAESEGVKSISKEGYEYFQQAIKALEQNLIDSSELIDLLYDNNVRCDQTIEGLADDIMSLQKEVK